MPPYPRALYLSQSFQRIRSGQAGGAVSGGVGGRDRVSGGWHDCGLHHGAGFGRGGGGGGLRGAGRLAAFFGGGVGGGGGVTPPHPSFMPGVAAICRKNGILLIADEVITAFGRTGAWTGSRLWGVKPDFTCTAKAITNAYFPFGAVMIAENVAEVFEKDESGKAAIGHGYTYSGHPVGAAAALACRAKPKGRKGKDTAAARGDELFAGLKALMAKHEVIGDVRGGYGFMNAIELVADRDSKKPADKAVPAKVQARTYEEGAMVRVSGNNIILSPPLVLTSADVGVILSALDAGFSAL